MPKTFPFLSLAFLLLPTPSGSVLPGSFYAVKSAKSVITRNSAKDLMSKMEKVLFKLRFIVFISQTDATCISQEAGARLNANEVPNYVQRKKPDQIFMY